MWEDIIGQALSILGMLLTVISFQMKGKKQILLMQTLGSIAFLASFVLLKSWSGVYLNVVFLFRNVIFYFKQDKRWARCAAWVFILSGAAIIAGVLGYNSYWDILPIVGAVFGTVAAYMDDENAFRLFKLGDSPCWLAYNISIPSIGGIICEAFNIVSIAVGLIRYRKKENSIKEEKGKEE